MPARYGQTSARVPGLFSAAQTSLSQNTGEHPLLVQPLVPRVTEPTPTAALTTGFPLSHGCPDSQNQKPDFTNGNPLDDCATQFTSAGNYQSSQQQDGHVPDPFQGYHNVVDPSADPNQLLPMLYSQLLRMGNPQQPQLPMVYNM